MLKKPHCYVLLVGEKLPEAELEKYQVQHLLRANTSLRGPSIHMNDYRLGLVVWSRVPEDSCQAPVILSLTSTFCGVLTARTMIAVVQQRALEPQEACRPAKEQPNYQNGKMLWEMWSPVHLFKFSKIISEASSLVTKTKGKSLTYMVIMIAFQDTSHESLKREWPPSTDRTPALKRISQVDCQMVVWSKVTVLKKY